MKNLAGCFVVPTRVGVNRVRSNPSWVWRRCPHARGGEPDWFEWAQAKTELSPRAWGEPGYVAEVLERQPLSPRAWG